MMGRALRTYLGGVSATAAVFAGLAGAATSAWAKPWLLFTSGGTSRLLTILDYGGTLTNPSDDTFVSETVVSSNGGKPQPDFNFCDQFHTLTA